MKKTNREPGKATYEAESIEVCRSVRDCLVKCRESLDGHGASVAAAHIDAAIVSTERNFLRYGNQNFVK